jgi:hypothetical protein
MMLVSTAIELHYTKLMSRPALPIDSADIERYVSGTSDFAFEVNVLRSLNDVGLACRHSGTYEDPISKKTRQFDIQAKIRADTPNAVVFRFAVECKNVSPHFPLVVSRVPRLPNETFIDAIISSRVPDHLVPTQSGHRIRLKDDDAPYKTGEMVGKAIDQVGKDKQGEVFAEGRDAFDKVAQALASSYDLLTASHSAAGQNDVITSVVLPLIVVPEGRLWAADYNESGALVGAPQVQSHVSFFVSKDWFVNDPFGGGTWYSLSHLEICTSTNLQAVIESWVAQPCFTPDRIWSVYSKQNAERRKRQGL